MLPAYTRSSLLTFSSKVSRDLIHDKLLQVPIFLRLGIPLSLPFRKQKAGIARMAHAALQGSNKVRTLFTQPQKPGQTPRQLICLALHIYILMLCDAFLWYGGQNADLPKLDVYKQPSTGKMNTTWVFSKVTRMTAVNVISQFGEKSQCFLKCEEGNRMQYKSCLD